MKLVDNARDWLHWNSIHAAGAGVILSAVATGLSLASSAGTMAGVIPVWAVCLLFCAIFILAIIGRLRKQKPPAPKPLPPKVP